MSPPNQTDLPPEEMLQLDQSVWPWSKRVRALVCWQGRQDIRAVIVEEDGGAPLETLSGDTVTFGFVVG